MAGSMNGALLALGVAGAVALAGRVRRGSFAHGWRRRARELLDAAADEEYVDSGDLIEVLEDIKDDRSVTGRPRVHVVTLLVFSREEGYLDSGEALEVIEMALGHGSRSVYGMSPDAAGRTLRLGFGKPRSNAGEALNDYRWHPQSAMSQYLASAGKKGKRKGSSARINDKRQYTHYVVYAPSMKIASAWPDAEDAKEALAEMLAEVEDYKRIKFGADAMLAARKVFKTNWKIYSRKFLKSHGRDPRNNDNWSSTEEYINTLGCK